MNGRQLHTSSSTDTQETERQRKRPALFHVETPALWVIYTAHTHTHTPPSNKAFLKRPYSGHIWKATPISEWAFSVFVGHLCAAFKVSDNRLENTLIVFCLWWQLIYYRSATSAQWQLTQINDWWHVKASVAHPLRLIGEVSVGYRKPCTQPSQGKQRI